MQSTARPADFFPLPLPREKQTRSLEFIAKAIDKGYSDIVIAAPTGVGKTGIGVAACLWSGHAADKVFQAGGYYLVTQKLLQDQLEKDFPQFVDAHRNRGCSLKSATEYECPSYGNCALGGKMPENQKCERKKSGGCAYTKQRNRFLETPVSVTNYPYFFTERTYLQQFPARAVLVLDECHTLERQILNFTEISVTRETVDNWTPFVKPPRMKTVLEFADWMSNFYLNAIGEKLAVVSEEVSSDPYNKKLQAEFNRLDNHHKRATAAIEYLLTSPKDWVFWQEDHRGVNETMAKPLFAQRFIEPLVFEPARIRVYMSAYPGPKSIFCRNLGLDSAQVARLDLNSPFPVENRPIHVLNCGSMGRKSMDETLPKLLRTCDAILTAHPKQRGIIHTHSYKLAEKLHEYLSNTAHAERLLFPRKSEERALALQVHSERDDTVLLSPSMAEGFSFDDDLARFQLLIKVPYPYLGDRQVEAKKNLDPEWYTLQTVSTLIQACGRIVRSETDHGVTYILDSDFYYLFEANHEFFPYWFEQALIWHNGKPKHNE